jgi:hypothetical protein
MHKFSKTYLIHKKTKTNLNWKQIMNERTIVHFLFYRILNQKNIYIVIKEHWVILNKEKKLWFFYYLQTFTFFSHKILF